MYNKLIRKTIKSTIVKGTIILTFAGLITRIIGFFFRIFLTGRIGAEGLGIYQLIFPVQIVCYSLCTIGFEMSISKLVAAITSKSKSKALQYLFIGMIISVSISLIISCIVYTNSLYISKRLLFEERCNNLIRWMSISIPFASIHACICGYYLGIKKSDIPAISQVIEQIIRVLSIICIIILFDKSGITVKPVIAVIGSLIGEICSALYCLILIKKHHKNILVKKAIINNDTKKTILELMNLSVPLTLNKLMLSILQSIQSILIPSMLIRYGCSAEKSLSLYGIILGLVLPLIMFPGAIINSLSLMILPSISEAESCDNADKIRLTTERALTFSYIFGVLCMGLFARYGNEISSLLFHNNSGKYICLLGALCPFIFITSTLGSTINGLGHTEITFRHNIISTLIQIGSIIYLIPKYGIIGYICGLIISSIINSICHYISMYHLQPFKINFRKTFVYPFMYIFLLIKACDSFFITLIHKNNSYTFIVSCFIICTLYIYLQFRIIIQNKNL